MLLQASKQSDKLFLAHLEVLGKHVVQMDTGQRLPHEKLQVSTSSSHSPLSWALQKGTHCNDTNQKLTEQHTGISHYINKYIYI